MTTKDFLATIKRSDIVFLRITVFFMDIQPSFAPPLNRVKELDIEVFDIWADAYNYTTYIIGGGVGAVAADKEYAFPQAPVGRGPEKAFAEGDKDRDVKDGIGGEMMELQAINKEQLASTELWRIIEEGYSPQDPMNLTRREVVDHQLNAIAIDMINLAITPKDHAHIRSLKTAKEAWDELDKLFLGNGSIQCSRFCEVMANDFVMVEGESPEEMYRHLIALSMQMRDLGATFVDDLMIKKKFYIALLPWSGNKKRNSRSRNSCYNCGD
ncbi:hypothetical protein QYE76_054082 [Lolium multiflorum]|uniref:Uncharacterized protein n=1 Tax=Lolium multiflorum TaxID=4521 RepID=A0AAD8SWZ8_LOLMU|nr:hypothetical protein QYE76_054082 [Lolium multiflorum]